MTSNGNNQRRRLQDAVAHLSHVLPDQAPILNFVHHNTLHGYQHLPFEQALAAAERAGGARSFQPEADFRRYYAEGRIRDDDLDAALTARPELAVDAVLAELAGHTLHGRDVYRAALLHDIEPISPAQLAWRLGAGGALSSAAAVALWEACLDVLNIDHDPLHPEELTDLSHAQAESWFAGHGKGHPDADQEPVISSAEQMQADARANLDCAIASLGVDNTLRGLLLTLTGQDVLEFVRPMLIRYLGAYLDEGVAAWSLPQRRTGFYQAWRRLAQTDPAWLLAEIPAWREQLDALPDDATDAVASLLHDLHLPPKHWAGYLQRVALEIPGWSGMVSWRQQRAGYAANNAAPVALMDYLAVRLCLDQMQLARACAGHWRILPNLDSLRHYFAANLAEFQVRSALFLHELPEYLAAEARRLIGELGSERSERAAWRHLADMIWTWRHVVDAAAAQATEGAGLQTPTRPGVFQRDNAVESVALTPPLSRGESEARGRESKVAATFRRTAHHHGWRLFLLAQHLGLDAAAVRSLGGNSAAALLAALDGLTPNTRGMIWLTAYERRYRESIFGALAANRGRGAWSQRCARPAAQAIFCMDDREEGIRRHLEEINPQVETLGAAGFFGVPIHWRGLDDDGTFPLCPIVVTPANEVREIPQPGCETRQRSHEQRRGWLAGLRRYFHQEMRRNLLSSALVMQTLAPLLLPVLLGKTWLPQPVGELARRIQRWWAPAVPTRLWLTAQDHGKPATPEQPRLGFTIGEQADRVAGFLRSVGLTGGFAPLVILFGHGSISQNNPHLAAYDCGACSGRHGGPNARVFAAMANQPEVRKLLRERGIAIPADSWFFGAEHNTANEAITWFDLEQMPIALHAAWAQLDGELEQARRRSAHERCRRLASAPRSPTLSAALQHMLDRSVDFSQARPELGHATNAAAFIGRRSMSRGAFFDRRVFLISYDPTQDPEGRVLENILLAAGPVGAGINLEYYFSSVDRDRYGCGSKTPHNITGLFGVMEGTASDLRTGLPRQMTEIHEAMRLLVVTEHRPAVLVEIYQRQAPLRELIGNGWIQLASMDPDTGSIWQFDTGTESFVQWQESGTDLPKVADSGAWYAGHSGPLAPALIDPVAGG
ncbi:MAG: DUF2309 domain-containing protein [Methylococcaceae bacterium]|nr:MAG: DUF2309 domain-containing protein [Methylococcaceae bacterium]